MGKKTKASLIVFKKRRGFRRGYGSPMRVSTSTGTEAFKGVLYANIATTGAVTGTVYLSVDTAGTKTAISA
jgi:hypothetical protein